ncbi:hypothetical protein E2C01_004579 [Portunus trituberculatus]|uniref:Uncharacterized protein n=1 Tax=Portunus trituberculatus TaxID=210409 RepID=A0A5B7CTC8_PORTR|nr:hypothetical protein [Portunus trituberculatus]
MLSIEFLCLPGGKETRYCRWTYSWSCGGRRGASCHDVILTCSLTSPRKLTWKLCKEVFPSSGWDSADPARYILQLYRATTVTTFASPQRLPWEESEKEEEEEEEENERNV